jgi:hypothetical protein
MGDSSERVADAEGGGLIVECVAVDAEEVGVGGEGEVEEGGGGSICLKRRICRKYRENTLGPPTY